MAQPNVFTLAILVLLFGTLAGADPLDEVRASFTYSGTPIHPGIIELFDPGMADLKPQILEVDLAAAQNSNRFMAGSFIADANGWMRPKNSDPDDHSGFGYRFIGHLPSGALVVQTEDSGGGSGRFESAMLFSIRADTGLNDDGTIRVQHVLHLLREVGLGDRVQAVLHINGSKILIDRSNALDAAMRGPLVLDDPLPAANASGAATP